MTAITTSATPIGATPPGVLRQPGLGHAPATASIRLRTTRLRKELEA